MGRISLVALHVCLTLLLFFLHPAESRAFNLRKEAGRCFSGGCDVIGDLNQRIDRGIQSKANSLVGPAKDAFLEIIDVLFDKKLTPLLNDLDLKLATRMDQANKIIIDAEKGIESIIKTAAKEVEEVSDKITGDIKDRIIDESFNRADQLITNLFAEAENLIYKVDCLVDGKLDSTKLWVQHQLRFIPRPWNACYGYSISLPASDDYPAHYKIARCEMLRDLDNSKTVRDLKDNYWRLSYLAKKFKCVTSDNVGNRLMKDDARNYSKGFEIWRLATGDQ